MSHEERAREFLLKEILGRSVNDMTIAALAALLAEVAAEARAASRATVDQLAAILEPGPFERLAADAGPALYDDERIADARAKAQEILTALDAPAAVIDLAGPRQKAERRRRAYRRDEAALGRP